MKYKVGDIVYLPITRGYKTFKTKAVVTECMGRHPVLEENYYQIKYGVIFGVTEGFITTDRLESELKGE